MGFAGLSGPGPLRSFFADLGVLRAKGFAQKQHAGFDRKRTAKGHALTLASIELAGVARANWARYLAADSQIPILWQRSTGARCRSN